MKLCGWTFDKDIEGFITALCDNKVSYLHTKYVKRESKTGIRIINVAFEKIKSSIPKLEKLM